MRPALVVIALIRVTAGCAGALPNPAKSDARPTEAHLAGKALAVPGEAMEYQVALRGVTVGRVQVAVGKPGWVEGRPAIIVRSRGASAGLLSMIGNLRWELTTTLDLETGEVLREVEESWLEVGGKQEHDRNEHSHEHDYNLHAAAGALRAWRSSLGDHTHLDVRIDRAEIDVELHDAAREMLGNRPAVRYEGIALEKYAFRLWLSDDAARVPLLLRTESKWGQIEVELVDYDPVATSDL
jgi:hypothetical protein